MESNSKPLLSIVLISFNTDHDKLVGCFESIASYVSGYKEETEVIVIDDGSTDHFIRKAFEDILSKKANAEYVLEENGGAGKARNNGLSHASGKYIIFVDSDDQLEGSFSQIREKLTNDEADLFMCPFENVNNAGKAIIAPANIENLYETLLPSKRPNKKDIYPYGTVWAKVFRREYLVSSRIEFDERVRISEDVLFMIDVAKIFPKIEDLDIIFYQHILNVSSLTHRRSPEKVDYIIYFLNKLFIRNKEPYSYGSTWLAYSLLALEMYAFNFSSRENYLKRIREGYKTLKKIKRRTPKIKFNNRWSFKKKILFVIVKCGMLNFVALYVRLFKPNEKRI